MHQAAGILDDAGYRRFSDGEMARRREAVLDMAAEFELGDVVFYGRDWRGSGVPWIAEWPTTREAVAFVGPEAPNRLLVQHHNHVPQARQISRWFDVDWAGPSTVDAIVDELEARGQRRRRIGWVGPLAARTATALEDRGYRLVDCSAAYQQMRLVKSSEELEWMKCGASHSDAGLRALQDGLDAGMSEAEAADLIERAYVPLGATTVIHHLGSTSMHKPETAVPRQHRRERTIGTGDAVTVEISAAWWGYPGQVLRTIGVNSRPTAQFQELHAVADAVFDAITGVLRSGITAAELAAKSAIIEEAGFTIIDDLLHGFGGGYLPPVLGCASRPAGSIPDFTYQSGMTLVVQPNIVTTDWSAGVQTGELLVVTDDGCQSLHDISRGFLQTS